MALALRENWLAEDGLLRLLKKVISQVEPVADHLNLSMAA